MFRMVLFLLNTLECVIIYLNSVFSSVYIISEGWIEQVFSVFPFLVDVFAFTGSILFGVDIFLCSRLMLPFGQSMCYYIPVHVRKCVGILRHQSL
jgi:hypothetical protein